MNISINPFQQLYVADNSQSAEDYVELFSDKVLQTAINPIFQGGNVVLLGAQGSGKTMILNLLRPETRLAYYKKNKEFPVNAQMRDFVSAGINLTRSRITDISQVSLYSGSDLEELPYYFADFFNYLIVKDLIRSCELIGHEPNVFGDLINLEKEQEFADRIVSQPCWFGALSGAKTLEDVKKLVDKRIEFYRRWVNGHFMGNPPPDEISESKSNIGEPISKTAECLRDSKMLARNIPILIRVDQIDELHRAFSPRQKELLLSFRKMINRAFAARDDRVTYRAGTRRYGWSDPTFQTIWGSEARLEERRDYLKIDMDSQLFMRGENKNSIFNRFAEDTFRKRVQYYFKDESVRVPKDFVKTVFGRTPISEERLRQLNLDVGKTQIDRALSLVSPEDRGRWSDEWRELLYSLYRSSHSGMLDAVLASAWGRQTGGGRQKDQHREKPPPEIDNPPWRSRKWWRKERLKQGVLQLSARNQQRYMWWGYSDVISLSGGNITVFLHICHRIWDAFLKKQSSLPENHRSNLFEGDDIDYSSQFTGILFASNDWFSKLPEEPFGNSRQRVVEQLGIWLNGKMLNDKNMSYPGGNGISIALTEYNSPDTNAIQLRTLLKDMEDFGVLISTEHSSKSKAGGRRKKFYLHPILCPRFQLPESRTKEPYYWKLSDLVKLVKKAKISLPVELE